jgi:tetratricopeptide (TPR) repeat protein
VNQEALISEPEPRAAEAQTSVSAQAIPTGLASQWWSARWFPYVLIGLATLLVWGQTVSFHFVWDDEYFIRDLQSIRSLRHVPEMFTRLDAQSSLPEGFVLFRPIRTVHYALLYWLGQSAEPRPWIYHLANVLWHGGAAMMLFAVARLLLIRIQPDLTKTETQVAALLVGLAFAVHPVTSEVVCWAKSLDDILAAFFVLAALREVLQIPGQPGASWRGLLFFALAVYSKESAVPFAILPFVIFWRIHRLGFKDSAVRTGGFVMVAAIYVVHRHLVIGHTAQTAPISGTYAQTLIDMFPVVPKYFRLLWGIPPFCIDYGFMQGGQSLLSPAVLGGLVLLLALAAGGLVAFRGWHRGQLVGFGLLWAGLFLLPVSNLVPMMQYMAERFLYLPLIGWLLALCGLALVLPRRRLAFALALLLVTQWAASAWHRSWIWHDAVTLFVRSSQEGPKTSRIENNAVSAILKQTQVAKLFSYDPKTKLLDFKGLTDPSAREGALRTLETVAQIFPENSTLLSCLGICHAAGNEPEAALPFFRKASELEPKNLAFARNYARAALDANKFAIARSALEAASRLAADDPPLLGLWLNYDWQTEDFAAAREVLVRLNRIAPSAENDRWMSEVEKKLGR